ncbi:probable nucleoredoxin 1 [Impatiens glandulifera]|uniref:probable nucleoredoxin 1 n=1 Tax=Impatiens glandulifera TaxID=253017 RepID=UPI001FB0AB03|nr:probable nucleoredoxin 1 [Impatiens glandulifera]XP_047318777.1 probable nucleoredoxin 1 [Impatiens glandulifera]
MADQEMIEEVEIHDLTKILSSPERDFLIRNNGEQVKLDSLKGKKVALYFSASWCGPCKRFTPTLVEAYNELTSKGDFEIVFVSADEDEESFTSYFSKMPWLAIPYSDSEVRESLDSVFEVNGIPFLVFIDDTGEVVMNEGVELIKEYGAEAYPFTVDSLNAIRVEEEEAKKNQSLNSLLVSKSSDLVISSDGKKIPVSSLQGKMIGLYFSDSSYGRCVKYTKELVKVYKEIQKENGSEFEMITIPLDDEEDSFKEDLKSLPWLALPFKDKRAGKLVKYFELSSLPTLVIIGPDGNTLQQDVADIVGEHGSQAYPFTAERFEHLEELKRKKLESQTLEEVLVSEGGLDFVIGKEGVKVPISDLVGKTILLYFSAHWCPPCRAFLPKLTEVYNQIKEKDAEFELIFVSSDRDQASFDDYFATMPWLALPFGDERKEGLSRLFKVQGIPTLVALGKTGRTVSTEVREMVMSHGAKAYPFDEEKRKEIEKELDDLVKGLPVKVKVESHEHELVLAKRKNFCCDECDGPGEVWSYYCDDCDFDLHPKCALKEEEKVAEEEGKEEEEKDGAGGPKEGWVCDGEVCQRAA